MFLVLLKHVIIEKKAAWLCSTMRKRLNAMTGLMP